MRRQRFLLFRVYRFQDAKAYAELYDLFYERIRRFLLFKLAKKEDVDELTSEVFLRAWEFTTSSQVENAGALFYKIARNLIADFYRAQSKRREDGLESAEELAGADVLAEQVMIHEESDELLRAMKKLKEEYREVLVMRFLDQMSIKEIAGALEKTSNNVRVLLSRAKKALKESV